MVGVHDDAAARDIGHGVHALVLLDLHADAEPLAVAAERLDPQELRIVFAERLLGLELQLHGFASALAFKRLLKRRQQLAIAAVQVGKLAGRGKLDALSVGQRHAHADDGVWRYDHDTRLRARRAGA